ncbi:hypothetical protein DFS34DRAFT_600177 [Phlyctochytrium arcticum]|nr:hypothetical protein DFS34DRAFT_600177 [Phlyctochytrium arcticum]
MHQRIQPLWALAPRLNCCKAASSRNLARPFHGTSSSHKELDISQAATVRVKHPRTLYKEDMRERRKAYFEEAKIGLEAKKMVQESARAKEQARKDELAANIRAYKAEKSKSFASMDTEATEKKEGSETAVASEDPVIVSRRDMHAKRKQERSQIRFENFVRERSKQVDRRLESLMYLYHSAGDFVTYDNLDTKIEELSQYRSPQPVPTLADQREKALRTALTETALRQKIAIQKESSS